jgi:hypothetical protein
VAVLPFPRSDSVFNIGWSVSKFICFNTMILACLVDNTWPGWTVPRGSGPLFTMVGTSVAVLKFFLSTLQCMYVKEMDNDALNRRLCKEETCSRYAR